MDDDEDFEIEDCPSCGRTYDDADRDYLICHHCGYDAEEKTYKPHLKSRSIRGYGVDPDVKLDDWS